MARPTQQAVEVARQFRKAIALDLVTRTAQESYELLALTVKGALDGLRADPKTYVTNRQQLDAAKVLLGMAGMLEPAKELDDTNVSRLSLAELEKMIAGLKVVEHSAAPQAPLDSEALDFLQ